MGERVKGYAHRVDIVGDVPTVWRAMTEAPHLTRWCAPDAQMRPRAGGLFRASVDRVTELEASIDVFDPNRRLRLIYLPSPTLPPSDTAVVTDFIVEPSPPPGGGVIIRVLGSGPDGPQWETQVKRMKVGWSAALSRLKVYVETQMGAARGGTTAGGTARGASPSGALPGTRK